MLCSVSVHMMHDLYWQTELFGGVRHQLPPVSSNLAFQQHQLNLRWLLLDVEELKVVVGEYPIRDPVTKQSN